MTGPHDKAWTETDIYGSTLPDDVAYPPSRPVLRDSPFYLPNIIAAIIASVGIVVGAVGTWASLNAFTVGGLEFKPWGTVVLALGAAAAVALFVQLNLGRTSFDLRWSIPLCWGVLVAAVACLAIALVQIVKIRSFGADYEDEVLTQVGWGLRLGAICAGVLCVTAPIVASQIAKAADAQAGAGSSVWTSGWRWAALAGSAGILVVSLFNAYNPTRINVNSSDTPTATTVTAPPVTSVVTDPEQHTSAGRPNVLPADATPCPATFANTEFSSSAVGTSVTSCAFAEAVRSAYINNPGRNRSKTIDALSPITKRSYTMSCVGNQVVRCIGGDHAVVYVY
jgi:hypothetical protein